MDRDACERMDRECALSPLRERFALPAGVLYFDGNSLGALPRTTAADIGRLVREEWGQGLVESWLDADWFFLAQKAGDAIAPLIGASQGEVVVADSTSVNLFKLAASLLRRSEGRRTVVTERGNFPTDVYILEGLVDLFDGKFDLALVEPEAIAGSIDEDTALVLLTHVNFRTGAMHDMARIAAHCTAQGVPVIWDLSHSAGRRAARAQPLGRGVRRRLHLQVPERRARRAGLHLHGGERHRGASARDDRLVQPCRPVRLRGSLPARGRHREVPRRHPADPFAPRGDARRRDLRRHRHGRGRRASRGALSQLLIRLADERLADATVSCSRARGRRGERGSQVSFRHGHAYAVSRALRAEGVVADFRSPDILRFGLAPLYIRHVDVWDAVDALARIMASESWKAHGTDTPDPVT